MGEPTGDSISVRSLNDFPEHLLLYILSFLPTLDAIQTSFISRKWRSLWSSVSSLNFDYSLFPPTDSPDDTRRIFADFVDQTLILRTTRSPLRKLRFQFDFREYLYCCHIDSWIRYAINHKATELDIDFYIDRGYHDMDVDCTYDFSFSLLKNGCIRVFKLCRAYLNLPVNMSTMGFVSLQSLYLDQICLTDDMVLDLISGCSNLESLVLETCYGLKSLKICTSKLKMLSLLFFYTQIEEEESVEICTPNLQSITIQCFEMGKYYFKETQTLVQARVEFMHEEKDYKYWSKVVRLFRGVKRLIVNNWWFRLRASEDASSGHFLLNNLTYLELQTGMTKYDLLGIAYVLECSPNLERLVVVDDLFKIDEDETISDELLNTPINFSMPSLRQVKIRNFSLTEYLTNFLSLLVKQGAALEKIVLVPPKVGDSMFPSLIATRQHQADPFHIQKFGTLMSFEF